MSHTAGVFLFRADGSFGNLRRPVLRCRSSISLRLLMTDLSKLRTGTPTSPSLRNLP